MSFNILDLVLIIIATVSLSGLVLGGLIAYMRISPWRNDYLVGLSLWTSSAAILASSLYALLT